MSTTDTIAGGWETTMEGPDHQHVMSLYDAHVTEVYRYVHRLCLDHVTAEDVTQDVFVAALREPASVVSVGWLMRAARNRMIDLVRREATHRDKVRVLQRQADQEPWTIVDDLTLRAALEQLRPEHRIVLMLHYISGISVAELADELGRSYKGAEGLLTRARAALRSELESKR